MGADRNLVEAAITIAAGFALVVVLAWLCWLAVLALRLAWRLLA